MEESILTSIKKLLMIDEELEQFDLDIVMAINTVLNVLSQMGVGPAFSITGSSEIWSDYLGDGEENLEMVKTYIFMRVRMIFDPPQAGVVIEVYNNMIKELETRLYMLTNYATSEEE